MDEELLNQFSNGNCLEKIIPSLAVIRLMKRCNARCQMYNFWKTKDDGFSWADIKRIIFEIKSIGCKTICFTGGEPTAYAHFFDAIKLIHSLNMDYGFISNGSTLNEAFIDRMIKIPPVRIYLSIDSPYSEVHDGERGFNGLWDRAFNGLKLMSNLLTRPKIVINYIVSNRNFRDLPEMVAKSEGKLFDEINLIPIRGMPAWELSHEEINEYNDLIIPLFFESLSHYGVRLRSGSPHIFSFQKKDDSNSTTRKDFIEPCHVSQRMIYIDDLGNVFPCNNTPYHGETFKFGNIFSQPLKEILSSERAKSVKKICGSCSLCASCDPVNRHINRLAIKRETQRGAISVETCH